jgi:hypothetical protein
MLIKTADSFSRVKGSWPWGEMHFRAPRKTPYGRIDGRRGDALVIIMPAAVEAARLLT